MQYFNRLYRSIGIRKAESFVRPKVTPIEQFEFSRDAVYHHVTFTENSGNLDFTSFPFNNKTRTVVNFITDMRMRFPSAIRKPLSPSLAISNVRLKNRDMKLMKVTIDKLPSSLIVPTYSYSLLNDMYRYNKQPLMPYHYWANITETLWSNVATIAEESDREQFIILNVPKVIPSYQALNMYIDKVNTSMLHVFDSIDKLNILEIYRWIRQDIRQRTIMNHVPYEHLHKVNLVFRYQDTFTLLNLGYLDMMISKDHETMSADSELIAQQHLSASGMTINQSRDDKIICRYFLSFLLHNQDQLTEVLEAPEEQRDEETPSVGDEPQYPNEAEEGEGEPQAQSAPITEDTPTHDDTLDAIVEADLKSISELSKKLDQPAESIIEDPKERVQTLLNQPAADNARITEPESADTMLSNAIEEYAELGMLTAGEYKSLLKASSAIDNLSDPYGTTDTIKDFIRIDPNDIILSPQDKQLPDSATVIDKKMLNSALISFDAKYVKNTLRKDVVASVLNVQKAGIIIQDYQVNPVSSILGDYEIHTVKTRPIEGNSSVIHFKIPTVDDEGNFTSNSNKYRMRKQRADLPIRKINDHVVALSTYYGKLFVQRDEAKVSDPSDWLYRKFMYLAQHDQAKVTPMNSFTNKLPLPRLYTMMSKNFKAVEINGYTFHFNYLTRAELINNDTEMLKHIENTDTPENRYVLVGMKGSNPILTDKYDNFYAYTNGAYQPIGNFFDLTHLDVDTMPMEIAEIKILGKKIPLVIVLGYLLGFSNLIKQLGLNPKVYQAKERVSIKNNEYVIAFKDLKLVIEKGNKAADLILAGFVKQSKHIKQYHYEAFDAQNVYMNILDTQGIGVRIIREFSLLDQLFIDPITLETLKLMKEPQTFIGLLLRSAELLTTDYHKDTNDGSEMQVRGYERFAGAVYREMINSVRGYKSRTNSRRLQLEMSPYAVWGAIVQDPTVKLVEDINVIQNLKDQEVVTVTGAGGRAKDAMSKPTRAFHINDLDTISEGTVDSGDVGINAYLSANPNFTSVRGISEMFDPNNFDATKRLSTAALLAPGSDQDDGKRTNLVQIQQSHTIAAQGYKAPIVRTGYETVVAHRTGKLFAYTAKQKGKVVDIGFKGIIVEYENGDRIGIPLGRNYGRAEGSYYAHDIVTPLKVGDTFDAGDCISYNTGFFEPDMFDPKKVILKGNIAIRTALYESRQTHEDSSAISPRLSSLMQAKIVKVKSFVVDFKQGISNLVKAGSRVDPETVLFYLTDDIANETGLFDDESLDALKRLSGMAPKAKYHGVLDKIEVFYHGKKEDMSSSLKQVTNMSDKQMIENRRSIGMPPVTGEVNSEYRIEGTPIGLDKAEIRIYIIVEPTADVGDKLVFANQMKTVVGEVLTYPVTTENGEVIDAIFGSRSIAARIVNSPIIMGTTIRLLRVVAKNAVSIYRS